MKDRNLYRDILFGLAVGYALGVPVEFMSRQAIALNPVTDMRGYGTYNLPPGTYEVRITSVGFRDTLMTNVLVSNSNIVTLDITLQLGAATSTVEVTATSEDQIQTSSSQISSQQLTELPINGRNFSLLP